ncbi:MULTISPECIES: N-acetylmuramoyl-L-alanine amidase family protein [Cyanophyceae]|uniref:N-acetylmuramoyl-L-alanine amidase family protein n=1 Tax=Cyanophyceae TaxID=3028117 RepID=UPI00232D9260|nr:MULTISPECIES: N-acetylmuramoyl-L-alanine amidase [Cyanophyceae]MDB9356355.1 N-acetylmuramoyl-L-alanine amidase [Nodularia spumigena CS-587/03]MDB9341592.1 N-acetylmuramoyl-L-alanine amidase [Nodularia spumigena CS-589/07]MDB9346234.1 N-acetylmuramoyl-L-alanine amidase [Nodularia spumigena CS-588/01]MDB9353018.1 N-acetylmuramoyl-L-alanine amidase [Nodularia spumigena CS-588/05]MDB9399930.1 N-acetylmuramoyl-L-alanine amidase [Microcystis aeruginosa CS-567/02-A1]
MKICVDPGHGGTDPGAVGKDPFVLNEKDVNLSISLLLQKELEEKGHTVFLTRDTDIAVSLSGRATFANNKNADIFISIHCNSAGTNKAEGIETWIFADSKAGRKIAESVQKSLVATFSNHKNRGVKEANFQVLRETEMPAILVECEFLSNPTQLQFLSDQENQEKIAKAITSGI